MQRSLAIFVAAAMSVTGVAASFTSVQAGTIRAAPALAEKGPLAGVQKVQQRRRHVRRYAGGQRQARRHLRGYGRGYGHRGYRHYGHRVYRHYGHRYYRSRPSIGLGFPNGYPGYGYGYDGYGYENYRLRYYAPSYGYGGDWKEACARKYRSFDWESGTYLGYDGYRHPCTL